MQSVYGSEDSCTDSELSTNTSNTASFLSTPTPHRYRANKSAIISSISEDEELMSIPHKSLNHSTNVDIHHNAGMVRLINSQNTSPLNMSSHGDSSSSIATSSSFLVSKQTVSTETRRDLIFYNVFKAMIKRKKVAIIIQDADNCDNLSWNEILRMLNGVDLQLGILLTMKAVPLSLRMNHNVTTTSDTMIKKSTHGLNVFKYVNISRNHSSMTTSHVNSIESNMNSMIKVSRASGDPVEVALHEFFLQTTITCDVLHSHSSNRMNEAYKSILLHPQTFVLLMNPLTSIEVKDLLRHTEDVDEKLVNSVLHITSGNAFWCKAVVRYIKESGKLEFLNSIDHNFEYNHCNSRLIQSITNDFDKLNSEENVVAKYAAIIGIDFQLSLLRDVLPKHIKSHLPACLDTLEQRNLFYCIDRTNDDATLSFQNPLIRLVIYNLTPPG